MRCALAALAALAAGLAAPHVAAADCARPRPFTAPSPGSTLPPSPRLWVFGTAGVERVEAWAGSVEVPTAVSVAWKTDDVVAVEVAIDYAGDEPLEVRVFEPGATEPEITASYRIDPRWSAPSTAVHPVSITEMHHELERWGCSHTNSVNLALDIDAPSYRFEWASTREQWDAGERTVYTLPATITSYYHWEGAAGLAPIVELGHVSCLGYTIPPENAGGFERQVFGGVVGMYPDGTETPLPAPVLVPLDYVEPDTGSSPREGCEIHGGPDWTPAPATPDSTPRRWPAYLALAACLVAAALAFRRILVVRARG